MLHQELPPIDVGAARSASRWLAPALVAGAAISRSLLLLAGGSRWSPRCSPRRA